MSRHHRSGTISRTRPKEVEAENAVGAKGRLPSSPVKDLENIFLSTVHPYLHIHIAAMHASIDDELLIEGAS